MERSEFENRFKAAADDLAANYKNEGYNFNPDLTGIEESDIYDFYWHVLDDLKSRNISDPRYPVWMFENFGRNLGDDDQFCCKLGVLEMYGHALLGRKDLLSQYMKSLNRDQIDRLFDADSLQEEVSLTLIELKNS